MALSGKGGTGVANGIREGSKTPRGTYTSHPIPIKHHLSYASTFPTSRTAPRRLSQTFPSHNEGCRAPDGLLSGINREEAENGERMNGGQR